MAQPTAAWHQIQPYLVAFGTHYRLWLYPTIATTLFSVAYAMVMPRSWRAYQAIRAREEATGNQHVLGQFDSIDRQKAFQETILEVARNPMVVASVLKRLGPPADHAKGQPWPTSSTIESLRSVVSMSAAKGSEFGRSDMFYLSASGKTPQEAILRTKALCDEVERHLGELRDAKAQSMVRELEKTLQLAQSDLDVATSHLEAMERDVGPDLGELRVMNEVGSGDSNLRSGLNQIKTELRQAESSRESLIQLRDLLTTASRNSDQLLATPGRLLDSQPALRRLKEGLVDAQLRCATLRGKLNDAHPTMQSALRTENEIRLNLSAEVATALKGVEADLQANSGQIDRLDQQHEDLGKRLDRLAGLRARYSNLVADVRRRTEIVDTVRRDLSNAQASSSSAAATSLLTRFQEPYAGDRPAGPAKKAVIAAGLGGGLALGAGLVFLFMPIGPNGSVRRWNDYVNIGRRATDQILGRRVEDRTTLAAGTPRRAGTPTGNVSGRRTSDSLPVTPASATTSRRDSDVPVAPNPQPSGTPPAPLERRQVASRRSADHQAGLESREAKA